MRFICLPYVLPLVHPTGLLSHKYACQLSEHIFFKQTHNPSFYLLLQVHACIILFLHYGRRLIAHILRTLQFRNELLMISTKQSQSSVFNITPKLFLSENEINSSLARLPCIADPRGTFMRTTYPLMILHVETLNFKPGGCCSHLASNSSHLKRLST